ncbi:conserved hypothetical protein [delta proteobacterium NaphS2]|nr:conserved hypothetical protein [delta proteobacterium NaphS2]
MMPKGATKKQAMDKLEEIRKQVDGRVFLATKQIPKFSEVAKDWIQWKKPNLRITTVAVHIIPPDIVHNKARRIFCFCLIDLSLQGDA